MVTILISQCTKALDFKPVKPWSPLLPPYAWSAHDRNFLLCGFERPQGTAIALKGDLSGLLLEIYHQLTISECARIFVKVKDLLQVNWDPSPLLGYKAPHSWDRLAPMITLLPMDVQNWFSHKNISVREIEVLTLVDFEQTKILLEQLAQLNPSKSVGSLIIDLGCQLLGQGKPLSEVMKYSLKSADDWAKHLNKMRFPETAKREQEREQSLKSLPWPAHSQIKWIREGDQAGVEVRFQIFSDKDLAKHLEGFEHVKEAMSKDAWKLN